eukprot:1157805-Pelagomonas_calceolata.AAC.9
MRLQHIAIKAEGHRLGAKVVDAEAAHDFGAALDHVPKVQHVVGGSQLATHGLHVRRWLRKVCCVACAVVLVWSGARRACPSLHMYGIGC